MTDQLCEQCKENEVKNECVECGKKLCEDCTEVFSYEETHPGYRMKGQSFIGAMSEGTVKKKLCIECMREVDII